MRKQELWPGEIEELEELYKSDYEQRQAVYNANIKAAEERKTTMQQQRPEAKDFIIRDKITTKIMNMVCSKAVDYNRLPVDMGYKTNNLNTAEFKSYATRLMKYVETHDPIEYSSAHDRDQRFYHLRDVNRRLIDDSVTVHCPRQRHKPYNISDTAIYLKNTEELLECAMQTIEDLSQRLLTARECAQNDRDLVEVIMQHFQDK